MGKIYLRGMHCGGFWLVLAFYTCFTGAGLDSVQGEMGMPSFAVSAAPPLRPLWPYQYLQRDSQAKQAPASIDAAQAKKALGKSKSEIDADNLLLGETLQMSDEDDQFDLHILPKNQGLRVEDQGKSNVWCSQEFQHFVDLHLPKRECGKISKA